MTSSCPKRRAKRTCALMAERTPCAASRGDEERDFPEPAGRRGDRVGRSLDEHRRISDTGHIYLLVGNNLFFLIKEAYFYAALLLVTSRCAIRGTYNRLGIAV